MSGLLSIAPLSASVEVLGQKIPVYGVSLKGVVVLLDAFPELRTLFAGGTANTSDLMRVAPNAVAAIIAAGVGYPGDPDQEEAARRLPLDAQADLLAEILRFTLPNGISAFIEKMTALMGTLAVDDAPATAPVTNSRKRRKP